MDYPELNLNWSPGYRIIPTRFPSIYLYDRVADQDEFDLLNEIESMTNDRLREEIGSLNLVPESERIFGNGCGPIMSAFTHLNPLGSRFSNGSYGVFYAANDKETAIAETRYHSEKFMRATKQEPTYLQMRLYCMQVKGSVVDLRHVSLEDTRMFDRESYTYSQTKALMLRQSGANGLVYPSVRNANGECLAAFKTTILRDCLHASYLEYHWNGHSINYVTEKIS
ncbi:RES family NAD+ phosphorylase [Undibacterium oligocarboniphilum]|uniref:RES family NAD+ phosphorylase n=1 Tax=Undibacterium oligocarboniphilum TaxID=666702 RepID=A0A850QJT5_9BURK|nr:RES family NAD+ phosphorylase [Undibacterium oligocarboniphilum]MBC3871741.1 RES family NAD+ phosphorylase [Undibacterium oligocarboniphilum]NVO79377.1 RES family NAD+ phosphorylase [Undibacterium oligocarboniphilum]